MPRTATSETRQLYRKVVTVPWEPDFAKLGYRGGHTDALSQRFVAAQIAPRLAKTAGSTPVELASTKGKVRNPRFESWKRFGVGSYVISQGYQEYRGVRSPVKIKTTLVSKGVDRVHVEREFFLTGDHETLPAQVHSYIAESWIEPTRQPRTDPASKITKLPGKSFKIKGLSFETDAWTIAAPGDYQEWGSDLKANVYMSDDLPGRVANLELDSHFAGEPFKYSGHVVDYKVVR